MTNDKFIRNDQFNFIKRQVFQLVNGHATVNDQHVIGALESLSIERVQDLFTDLTEIQKGLLQQIVEVSDKEAAEQVLLELESHVIPFKEISEQRLKKLFPKVKKLKLPTESAYLHRKTFLSYDDVGSKKRYMIMPAEKGMIGIAGSYEETNMKQICAICNRLTPVYMFMTKTKGEVMGTYTKRSNYICQDADNCNHHVMDLEKVAGFVRNMGG